MRQLIQLSWFMCGLSWMSAAIAADRVYRVTFGDDLANVPMTAWLLTIVLALLGGLAATLQRLSTDLDAMRSVRLEITKDLVASVVAGLAVFFVCEWQGIGSMLEAVAITMAGYGGSLVLDKLLARAIKRIDSDEAH